MHQSTVGSKSMSHAEWEAMILQRKEQEREARREERRRLAEERERRQEEAREQFDRWCARKSYLERAQKLLSRIDTSRAVNDRDWFEAAVALASADRMLGITAEDAFAIRKDAKGKTLAGKTLCMCFR